MSDVRKEKFVKAWSAIHDATVKEVNNECNFYPAYMLLTTNEVVYSKLSELKPEELFDKLVKTRINIENLIGALFHFKGVKIVNLNRFNSFDISFSFGNTEDYSYSHSAIYILSIKNGCIVQIKEIYQYGDSRNTSIDLLSHNQTVFSMLSLRLITSQDE